MSVKIINRLLKTILKSERRKELSELMASRVEARAEIISTEMGKVRSLFWPYLLSLDA